MQIKEIIELVKDPNGEGFIPTIVRILVGSDGKAMPDRSKDGKAAAEGKIQGTQPKNKPTTTTNR